MRIHLDFETFSDVDIKRAGAFRYIQSPAFEILLCAYSVDGMPVRVLDLTVPQDRDYFNTAFKDLIFRKDSVLVAYNAAFEAGCIARHFGVEFTPDYAAKFRCTMLHGLYAGYTAGLDATGRALGIPEDKQKLNTGKALIRYFCVPCKPTKANGGRNRNYPQHDPDKWSLFKVYNAQDVEAEMEIERYLSSFPMPDAVQKQWETDMIINARGVAVDMEFVHGALEMGDTVRTELTEEAVNISGLRNPNSVRQLSQWLSDATGADVSNLRKETVNELLGRDGNSAEVQRMLKIRQELGKTSNRKYDAIKAAVCPDGRVRGLLQFYGANRTGRWCLTGDHEVLTHDGWVRLDKWSGGVIACWQPNGEIVSFQTAERVCFDYDGPVYEYNEKRISQVSTPDHKMYVKRVYRGEWFADTVVNMQAYRPSIPFTGWRRITPGQEHGKLRILVMVQADGHYADDGSVRFAFKKERKIERCKRLLRQVGIMFVEREYSDRTILLIPAKAVPLWLRQFKDKTFGPWLFDESPDVFFDELVYWDGYQSAKNSIQYSTCNKVNADLVQAFAHMSGRAAIIRTRSRSDEHENWKDAYVVDIWQNPGNCHEIRCKAVVSNYQGKVYCAVTPSGYFLIRRNGRVWVTGNSGRLVQVQNLPRTYTEPLELARELVKGRKLNALKAVYGSVQDTLSQLIRTAFVAPEGHILIDADFSAIEARVISWLAGEEWRLEVFRTHGKIYEASASQMFGVPIERIKKGNPEYTLRSKGKVAELALGYQGSSGALINMGALKMGIPEEDLPDIVNRWRETNKRIKDLWYKMNAAAVQVIQHGGAVGVNNVVVAREFDINQDTNCMSITLPSGRKIYYVDPKIGVNRWGDASITYMGVNDKNKWGPIETYGGKLVENCVQAIARDCLAQAIEHLEEAGLPVVFHVHDEAVIDVAPFGTEQEMLDKVVSIMTKPIPWAQGLPLGADGWVGEFFKKD